MKKKASITSSSHNRRGTVERSSVIIIDDRHSAGDSGHDPVISPDHYKLFKGEKEVIDLIKDRLTPEQFEGYLLGNMIKYNMRHQDKNGLEDVRKLKTYTEWYINEVIQ